jgi:hypothetical protein
VKEIDSKVRSVGRYQKNDIVISTYYGDNRFETCVRHPCYGPLTPVLAQIYTTRPQAELGHQSWIDRTQTGLMPAITSLPYRTHAVQSKTNTILSISLTALIKILVPCTRPGPRLRYLFMRRNPDLILFSIPEGPYKGSLIYNRVKQEASVIDPPWLNILEEIQAQKQDEYFAETVAENIEARLS